MGRANPHPMMVQWSDEDGCYVGTCPGLMLGGVHGSDKEAVYRELCQVVEEWLAIEKEDSGSVV